VNGWSSRLWHQQCRSSDPTVTQKFGDTPQTRENTKPPYWFANGCTPALQRPKLFDGALTP
jgi:hypothetical protein